MIQHTPALDGLRGIAILLVLAHHLTLVDPESPLEAAVLAVLHTGWSGVDLFFVLSGFLITGILIDARGHTRYFSNFYMRRVLRIFPLYYLLVFVSYHLVPRSAEWYTRLVGVGGIPPESVFWLFLSNVWMAAHDQIQHGILGVSWSLAIEEQFYLIWAVVVWLCPPGWLGPLALALVGLTPLLRAAAIAAGASEIDVYVLTIFRADALATGAWLAWAVRNGHAAALTRYGPWAAAAGLAGVIGLTALDGHTSWDGGVKQFIGYSLLAITGGGLLAWALADPAASRWPRLLSSGWLRTFGRYSYCLYLIHLPVMWTMRALVFDPEQGPVVLDSWLPAQALFYPIALGPALAVAWISWRALEEPFLRLKRFFPY